MYGSVGGAQCADLIRSKLGGLHSNAYISDLFASAFAKEGMKAYVEIVQRKEREIGCDVLTHQKVRPSHLHNSMVFAHSDAVERRRLRRQSAQDCDGWGLVDSSHGKRCHGGPIQGEAMI